ncbi:MAG: NYN domain-containing protein [Candidatus Sedimenticola sp. (ex Thyasira tokunagai)]
MSPKEKRRTAVYIDGFNLYHGCLQGHEHYKWLDIEALCHNLISDRPIVSIKFFTARIIAKAARRPDANIRQDTYLKAIKQRSNGRVEVIRGNFRRDKKKMHLYSPIPCKHHDNGNEHCHGDEKIAVWKNEEKQTDVSLAVHLINDAWLDLYDQAIIISNDTDLEEAIKIARVDHSPGKPPKYVGIITPTAWPRRKPAGTLVSAASWLKEVKESHLRDSQLPDTIPCGNGVLYRPPEWA